MGFGWEMPTVVPVRAFYISFGVTWVRDINITEPWNRAVRVQAIRIPGGEGEFRFHGCMMVSKSRVRSKDTETCSRSQAKMGNRARGARARARELIRLAHEWATFPHT